MRKIDMGGFKNEEVDVVFGDDTYKIMLDPPIEATRMLMELQGVKMDTDESVDKFKEFITLLICNSNPEVNKDEFKKSLTLASCLSFIDGYNELFKSKKKEIEPEVNPSQNY
jgi:hypothetical protein